MVARMLMQGRLEADLDQFGRIYLIRRRMVCLRKKKSEFAREDESVVLREIGETRECTYHSGLI